jgi:hypothetical protein
MKNNFQPYISHILTYAKFFSLLILISGVSLILFVKHWTDVRGLPSIESSVAKQLANLASLSPDLKNTTVVKNGKAVWWVVSLPLQKAKKCGGV